MSGKEVRRRGGSQWEGWGSGRVGFRRRVGGNPTANQRVRRRGHLKEEALSVYQQLQLIYDHLTHYRRINSSFSEMTSETVPLKEETLQTFKVSVYQT
uniref:Uncharacterized protein n=1 Tax=Timema cristinae TaxID=61476 RepID=A0A7R9CWE8_TIMCR|nr:unnamed protein product [Timema cristinae]